MIHIGLSPCEFYNLTPYELRCVICRYLFNTAKQWEHTRLISYTLYCINSADKMPIRDYMHLLTDSKPELIEPMSKEEQDVLVEKHLQILKQLKKDG